ncbi:MAG TPA: acetylornithine transaminase [Frankiaceae bacterium]|jgi:acetylornithine aminotransferase|nr:acetylornithine transaminase [Frankiaceae bacterium]
MSVTPNEKLLSRRDDVFMNNYGRPPIALVRGQGSTVYDADGHAYLDLIAGIAVCLLGHAHPKVIEAVTSQLSTLGHTSNLYATEPAVGLAEKLLQLLGTSGSGGRIFFCNSGAEANETAIKIARRTGRPEIIAAEGSFHGRTMGALSITGQPSKRAPFEPLLPGARFVPYGDAEALRAAVSNQTAAVFLEPTLGEGGVVPPPASYLQAARQACDEAGALLVMDEVQSVGRTGTWYAHQQAGIVPDVVTLAKGLAGGLPIGACIGLGAAANLLQPGDHGSTFGGNPVVCAAALAVIGVIESEGLVAQAAEVGVHLSAGLQACGAPLLAGVRGSGLWLAMILGEPVAAVAEGAMRDAGFLVNTVAPDTLRLAPPLVLTAAEADRFIAAVPVVLEKTLEIAKVSP